jgi:hypothetical protein
MIVSSNRPPLSFSSERLSISLVPYLPHKFFNLLPLLPLLQFLLYIEQSQQKKGNDPDNLEVYKRTPRLILLRGAPLRRLACRDWLLNRLIHRTEAWSSICERERAIEEMRCGDYEQPQGVKHQTYTDDDDTDSNHFLHEHQDGSDFHVQMFPAAQWATLLFRGLMRPVDFRPPVWPIPVIHIDRKMDFNTRLRSCENST